MSDFLNLILEPIREMFMKFREFLPNFLAMLVILFVGFLIAALLRRLLVRFLSAIGFDSWSDRMGFTSMMRKGDLWDKPSSMLGSFFFWIMVLITLMTGLNALKIHVIENMVLQFFNYLPRAASALLILVAGYLLSAFFSRTLLIAAVNAGYRYAKPVARAVKVLLLIMTFAMVMEQLQIAPGIVLAAFSIVFGGIVAALTIAFGVGGIDVARKMIESEVAERKPESTDVEHI